MIEKEIDFHKRLLHIAKELGDRAGEGDTYNNLGALYYSLCDFKQTIECSVQSLGIAKELGDRAMEAFAYCNLGNSYLGLGNFKKAIEYYKKHLSTAKELGRGDEEGLAYGGLAMAHHSLGDFEQAIEYHKKRLSITKELRQRHEEGCAYGDLGKTYCSLGDFKQAIEYHKQCLRIAKELGQRDIELIAYEGLGEAHRCMGDFKQAIEYHTKRFRIYQDQGQRPQAGSIYGNLGNAYHCLGDFKQALECHKQCLSIAKELGQEHEKGKTYGNIGVTYHELGDLHKAQEYLEKTLQISKRLGDRDSEGRTYGNLGRTYHCLGDFEQAIECQKQCISIANELGQRDIVGHAYACLGIAHYRLGDFKQAIEYHKRHLSIAKDLGQRQEKAGAYCNLGDAYGMLGDHKQAIEYHKKSFCIAKELGQRHTEAAVCHLLGRDFELSGALHEALDYYQSSVKLYDDVRALLRSEDVLKISFRDTCHEAYTALWRILLRLSQNDEALYIAEQGRAQALADLMKVQYDFALLACGSFEGKEAISNISSDLSAQTVFVALTGKSIYFWVICKEGPVQFRHRKVEEEDAVTFLESLRKGVFEENKITARVSCEDRSLDELRKELPPSRQPSQETKTSNDNKNSLRLFHDYFIGPIADLLEGDELMIVPDGPLCLAPFAAFLDDESRYLCQRIRTRILPSLTTLKLIANSAEDHHKISGVLLVGDPCLEKFTDLLGKPIFSLLPCARREVEMIGEMLGVPPVTGKEATKEEVLRRIGSVALVHIAAHGDMEAGEIALAPNPTATSSVRRKKDFMLKMADVQAIQLRARLVVLSCCHSARGRVTPEGVVGIGRAFLGAGARSVLVSLWAIDDEATMEFMAIFYKHLRDGNCASVAVNRARKCLRESVKFGAVKYWAPFVLIGDDVTIDFGKSQKEHCVGFSDTEKITGTVTQQV